jgi:hypothetical protein
MPNFDKTGPQGKGPKTGRGLGQCEGATPQGGAGAGIRAGRGLGAGRGQRQRQAQRKSQ